jgi:hypothetical protein
MVGNLISRLAQADANQSDCVSRRCGSAVLSSVEFSSTLESLRLIRTYRFFAKGLDYELKLSEGSISTQLADKSFKLAYRSGGGHAGLQLFALQQV